MPLLKKKLGSSYDHSRSSSSKQDMMTSSKKSTGTAPQEVEATVHDPAVNKRHSVHSSDDTSSLATENPILSWNPTDPTDWTIERVESWLRQHHFPESWISFFKKHKLYGQNFIKLLAYENFLVYEKTLPVSKNASYNRFQRLLKLTMANNVANCHIGQKSSEKNDNPNDSCNTTVTGHNIRSASESAILPNLKMQSKSCPKTDGVNVRKHQKTKSTSSLYRRSFISLRNSSPSNVSNIQSNDYPSNIKLSIPVNSHSSTETVNTVPQTSITPPLSPRMFRKHHKSSSSESSLLSALFGLNQDNKSSMYDSSDRASTRSVPHSLSATNKIKPNGSSSITSASSRQSPTAPEDKSSLWGKLKRRSQAYSSKDSPVSSIPNLSPATSSNATLTPSHTDQSLKLSPTTKRAPELDTVRKPDPTLIPPNRPSKVEDVIEEKYLPKKDGKVKSNNYILLTKDGNSFWPLDITAVTDVEGLKALISRKIGFTSNNFSLHLTDFECERGEAMTEELLKHLTSTLFEDTTKKVYVKNLEKPSKRERAATLASTGARSINSKTSNHSGTSGSASGIDQVSNTTTLSDIISFDEHNTSTGRRYPQTPSYYYDVPTSSSPKEETNYWNIKEQQKNETAASSDSKGATRDLNTDNGSQNTSFQVLRKESSNVIDFNKGRDSPYVNPDFAPKREAPKPPANTSPPRTHSLSRSSTRLRRATSKVVRPTTISLPPSSLVTSSVNSNTEVYAVSPSNSLINSYTPGSTHVLIPQPYRGAQNSSRKHCTAGNDSDQHTTNVYKSRSLRSNSVLSSRALSTNSSPSLLKKAGSKRVVSSASAADIFEENNITFTNAPALSESDADDSSDDIIWGTSITKHNEDNSDIESSSSDDIIWSNSSAKPPNLNLDKISSDNATETPESIGRKMALRPSPEVVYQNLEKFFPQANLDKPVLEGITPPVSPKNNVKSMSMSDDVDTNNSSYKISGQQDSKSEISEGATLTQSLLYRPKMIKRTKTIRTIAHEAGEKRKQSVKLKRHNTKMWGTRIFEVTDKRTVAINKSKNSKGEYKEFAWMKGEMIGKGSFGAVYLSLNVTTGEMMAVKQVKVPNYGLQDEFVASTVEALRSEVSTLKDLDHLNIVQYLGFEIKDNVYSLFLEYVAGGSVGSLIRMYGRFDEVLIRHLTKQVLEGLQYLHSRGILHRDMKADNLLLDQDGICKISDFGISKKSNDIYSNSDMTMRGTVFWMAPEMVDTKQGYSAKVDIWSLGCIVLEMFAGKRPWSNFEVVAAMFKIGQAKSAPPIPDDTLPLISKDGRQFLDECFKIDPEERPTAKKLLNHQFTFVDPSFDFSTTELVKFIRSNNKLNSSKLRISSHESIEGKVSP